MGWVHGAFAAVMFCGGAAHATPGYDYFAARLLGYDARDQKVYVGWYDVYGTGLPKIAFVHLRGNTAGKLVLARSYYRGIEDGKPTTAQFAAFEKKLQRLSNRLQKMPIVAARSSEGNAWEPVENLPLPEKYLSIQRTSLRAKSGACPRVDLRLTHVSSGATGAVTVTDCANTAGKMVQCVYAIPERNALVAIVLPSPNVGPNEFREQIVLLIPAPRIQPSARSEADIDGP